jgi:hypothetical protein
MRTVATRKKGTARTSSKLDSNSSLETKGSLFTSSSDLMLEGFNPEALNFLR